MARHSFAPSGRAVIVLARKEKNMEEVKVTVKYETHTVVDWILVIVSFIIGGVLVCFLKIGESMYWLISVSVLFALMVLALTVIQLCYVLTAKSVAQSAIVLKIEEEKRKQEEARKSVEDKKYEAAGKVFRVKIV